MPNRQKPARKNSADKKAEGEAERNKSTASRKSMKITLIYLAIGMVWILLTDKLAERLFSEYSQMQTFSLVKGLLYVTITAVVLFFLIYSPMKKMFDAREELENTNTQLKKSVGLYINLYQEIERKQVLLKSLINSTPDLILYKDTNSVYLGCNKAFEEFVGKKEEEIVGRTDYDIFSPELAELFRKEDMRVLEMNKPSRFEATVNARDEKEIHFDTLKSLYYDMSGSLVGLIGVCRDISERMEKEKEITYLSYHDMLTGLYNRTFFTEERKRMDNSRFLPLSIIIGDVNGLKLINDAFGHTEGDKVLVEIANVFRLCLRKSDIAARIGGDEFSILLPNTNNESTRLIVERIRKMIESRHTSGKMIYPNIALGCATKSSEEQAFEEIFILAEDQMYRRKLNENKSFHNSVLTSIKATMYEKSYETEAHAERLAKMAKKLGQAVRLSEEKLDELELVATLHDIGKISIEQNILTKIERLSEDDWREIRKHPEVGYRITYSSPELRHVSEYILCHHERWDGAGYPQGLKQDEIPLISRIISVVDAYDAMTQDREYRKALSCETAKNEIIKNAGTQFDPQIAQTFVDKVI